MVLTRLEMEANLLDPFEYILALNCELLSNKLY